MLLAVNVIISSQISTSPSRLGISYTYFEHQVAAGNVSDITSTGNTIQGDFKKKHRAAGRDEWQPVDQVQDRAADVRR